MFQQAAYTANSECSIARAIAGTDEGVVQIQLHEIRSEAPRDEFRRESRR
jgi:hypothetical protein